MGETEEAADTATAADDDRGRLVGRRDVLKAVIGATGAAAASRAPPVADRLPYLSGRLATDCGPVAARTSYDADTDTEPWTIAVLPDTQYYAADEELIDYAAAQTDWIVEHKDDMNIVFATHEGDLVNNGSDPAQWSRIEPVVDTLDGELPYSVVPGNHDWAETWDKSSGAERYVDRFGADRFSGYDWYGGTGPDELSHYQTFEAGGYAFLHLGLEWEPRDVTLDWAADVLDEHAALPTMITTHSYLSDTPFHKGRMDYVQDEHPASISNHAETVYDELVSAYEQVFMVFNGHAWNGVVPWNEGEYRQVSANDAGEPVYELLANYQGRANCGNGWMRLVTFVPGGGSCDAAPDRIDVRTYSPTLDAYQHDLASEFGYELDFDERFEADS